MFLDNIWLGIGLEQFKIVAGDYLPAKLSAHSAHNEFLRNFVEFGLFGGIYYLLSYIYAFNRLIASGNRKKAVYVIFGLVVNLLLSAGFLNMFLWLIPIVLSYEKSELSVK